VRHISDAAIGHLREVITLPDLAGTKYEIVAPLGSGGMGTVYRARDRELDREVALKVLHGPLVSPDARDRMLREAKVLASLEHPGIVPVHDVGTTADGRLFYAMKLIRGGALDTIASGERSVIDLLQVFRRICEAVAFAHARGIVHRDLKPSNIMLAMAFERQDRYSGVSAIAADVTRLLERMPLEAYHEHPGERLGRIVSRYRMPIALVLAYIVMRALLIVIGRS
jgi:predicted Ser/Thr protein kinase